jgi:uncharacterized protein (DUF58 family)
MLFPELHELIKLKHVVQHAANRSRYQRNLTSGDYTSILHGLGVEFETIRPYVIGDDVRYIDWRTTARIGKTQVKTFRAECDRNVSIVVDANAYMRFGTRGTFKSVQAAKAAAIMQWGSLQQQDRVGGLVFGDIPGGIQYFKASKSYNNSLRMLNLLCSQSINNHAEVELTSAMQHLIPMLTPQSLVIIISDFSVNQMPELQRSLFSVRRICNLMLLSVYDPSDERIPETGTIMCSHDQDQAIIMTNNSKGRQQYQDLWHKYRYDLENFCKKMQIPLIWLATTMDPTRKLWIN